MCNLEVSVSIWKAIEGWRIFLMSSLGGGCDPMVISWLRVQCSDEGSNLDGVQFMRGEERTIEGWKQDDGEGINLSLLTSIIPETNLILNPFIQLLISQSVPFNIPISLSPHPNISTCNLTLLPLSSPKFSQTRLILTQPHFCHSPQPLPASEQPILISTFPYASTFLSPQLPTTPPPIFPAIFCLQNEVWWELGAVREGGGGGLLIISVGCYIILIAMRPGKTTHIFQVGGYSLKFSGNFDSGNLRNVVQTAPTDFELEPAVDSYQQPCSSKAAFHFSAEGLAGGQRVRLVLRQLALLQCLKQDARRYRPFSSWDGQNYSRMSAEEISVVESAEGWVLQMNCELGAKRWFSFLLPYSYERYLNMVRDLPGSDADMYVHKEVLCYSSKINLVHAISVTSHSRATDAQERVGEHSNGILLPEKHLHPPKKYFEKPVILVSSRVHPGESSASWAMEGMLKFLTSSHPDAQILRSHFQIVLVPMLNPDGVEEGLYRLDTRGHNLNRYYLTSDNRQPSIYCMKHLIRHYHDTKRLLYYFDLHGHPNQKGAFLYGNALDQLPFQTETELFARLLAKSCPSFEEKFCIFDREQMAAKDRHDPYTKEGCARVFAFKLAGILHSYTIELGYHGLSDPLSTLSYSPSLYYEEGIAILSTVLTSCGLRQPHSAALPSLRKQLALEICGRDDRFRREERHLQQKKQMVSEIVEGEYWRPIYEQHFPEVMRPARRNLAPRHPFRLQKRESSYYLNLQSFFSEEATLYRDRDEERETSLGEVLEEHRVRLETTNITFKLHRTNHSLRSTNVTAKSDLEEKTLPNRMRFVKPVLSDPPSAHALREKLKTLKKPLMGFRSLEQGAKEEEHIFSDLNIREPKTTELQRPVRAGLRRNKIHSLFIQAHS